MTFLDPLLCNFIRDKVNTLANQEHEADKTKWEIAQRVNSEWDEHKTVVDQWSGTRVFTSKKLYYSECSQEANKSKKRHLFADSGETLRDYCETETYYRGMDVSYYLEVLSLEHLKVAKSLHYNEKVDSPIEALETAINEKLTAEGMKIWFDPPLAPTVYEKVTGWFQSLMAKSEDIPNKTDRQLYNEYLGKAKEIAERYKR